MEIKVHKRDVIWSYLGYFFQYCTSILILPLILSNVPQNELGLWYSFASVGTLVTYLDFGFSTTLVRNITYAWSGANRIQKNGFSKEDVNSEINIRFVKQILFTCKIVCLAVAGVALIAMGTGGTYYISYITRDFVNKSQMLVAWHIYAIGIFLNIYYNYCGNALRGIGLICQYQKIVVVSRIAQICISFVGIHLGYGIIALSMAYVISGFIIRFLSNTVLNQKIKQVSYDVKEHRSEKILLKEKLSDTWKLFKDIWYNAKKTGIISICSYATNQSLTLICSAYLGVEDTASYGLCLQLITALMSVAGILFSTYSPEMINCIALNKDEKYRKTFSMCIFVFWTISIGGILGFAVVSKPILNLIGSNTTIPMAMFLFMGLYMLLEHNHGEYTAYFTMRNNIEYLQSYIISSIAIVVLSWLLAYQGYNIYCLMGVHFVVQLLYNNWYWPHKAMKLMGTNLMHTIIEGATEAFCLVNRFIGLKK